ncbi:MAG TPA: 8-amino-7-oxononanoate synthase, partial [Cytophagales bacterium]|nr:8-amino-7-oxononanoate synthase [Cytophagales bacterium]
IIEVCEKHSAQLIVDEAHAVGVFGAHGEGLVNHYQLEDKVFACVYTFGKALGLHGAAVAGSEALKNYLINFARSFIYSTALPPHAYYQIQKAYELLPLADQKKLVELIDYFKKASRSVKSFSFLESNSQIQGVVVGDNAKARALSLHLFEKGIYAKAIVSPTVALGSERLRICLHTFNSKEQIDLLMNELNHFSK